MLNALKIPELTENLILSELIKLNNSLIVLREDFSDTKKYVDKMRFHDLPEINNKLDKLILISEEIVKAIRKE